MRSEEKRRECNRKSAAAHYAKRRVMLAELKVKMGCADCGFNKHSAALQFDHIDPATKKFDISKSLNRTWESILEEIAKCVLRCANCHAIKTADNKEMGGGRPRKDSRN